MYNSWLMYELAKERQEELLKEVEVERLIKKIDLNLKDHLVVSAFC